MSGEKSRILLDNHRVRVPRRITVDGHHSIAYVPKSRANQVLRFDFPQLFDRIPVELASDPCYANRLCAVVGTSQRYAQHYWDGEDRAAKVHPRPMLVGAHDASTD